MKRKVGLEKILSLDIIFSQFFTFVEFSCVNFTDQIFILGLFQSARGENGPHPNAIWAWHSLAILTSYLFLVFWASSSQFDNREQPPYGLHFHCAIGRQFWRKLAWPCVIHWKNYPPPPLVKTYQTQLGGQPDSQFLLEFSPVSLERFLIQCRRESLVRN